MHRSRYVIEANVELFERRLASGSLDLQQARAVADLLAKARAELHELDTDSALGRWPTQEDTTERTAAQLRARANRWQDAATRETSPDKAAAQLRLAERYEVMALLQDARDAAP